MSSHNHFYEPSKGHRLKHNPFKAIIAPRPIGWISTRSLLGVDNLAPYSFFNAFSDEPPIIGFVSCGWKDSAQNIKDTGEFCWNLVTHPLAESMNISSASVESDVDEFALSQLTKVDSNLVNVPRVKESPVTFECRLSQIVNLQRADHTALENWLILGEVVGVHIDNQLISDGVFDTLAAPPIMRAGGPSTYFTISEADRFDMIRPD